MRNFISVSLLMFALTVSAETVKLPPLDFSTSSSINGITVSIPVNTQISVSEESGKYNFGLHVTVNLSDFQGKFNQIVQSYSASLPQDRCGIRWFISSGQINQSGESAIMKISGEARAYWCHTSLRCTNVQDIIILGQRVGSTCISWVQDTAEEGPITQPFSGDLRLQPLVEGSTIIFQPFVVDVSLGGQGGHVTQDILHNFFNINLQAIAQQSINSVGNSLTVSFPPELAAYKPKFETAKFFDFGGGKLGLIADANIVLSGDQLSEKLKDIVKKQ